MRKKKNAFTLIELLAVIVILAVILVIAIPRILDVIETSKKDSFKNSAQLIADSAEKKKASDKLLDKDEEITCKDVAKINGEDYASCKITFDSEGIAKVNITGKGKFDGLKITNGTKENAEVKEITKPTYGMKAVEYISNLYDYDGEGLKIDNTPDQNIRYYGSDPNNYVRFNNELWRIIGVFGNNVKLVRSESLGKLSWDSSASSVNNGWGVNEWSQADLQVYLNKMYYGGTSVTCYNGENNTTTTCPTNTLDEISKSLIDYHTWNTGAPNDSNITMESYDTLAFYQTERGSVNGKNCTGGKYCNDRVKRTTTWTGYVALPYITDWAYASGEYICETNMNDGVRLNVTGYQYKYTCGRNNWMNRSGETWYLSPFVNAAYACAGCYLSGVGGYEKYAGYAWANVGGSHAAGNATFFSSLVFPTIYLKSNILIESGKGTSDNPYILKAGS